MGLFTVLRFASWLVSFGMGGSRGPLAGEEANPEVKKMLPWPQVNGPRLPVPVGIRAQSIVKNVNRQRRREIIGHEGQTLLLEAVKITARLAANASHSEKQRGDDGGQGRGNHDSQDRLVLAYAKA